MDASKRKRAEAAPGSGQTQPRRRRPASHSEPPAQASSGSRPRSWLSNSVSHRSRGRPLGPNMPVPYGNSVTLQISSARPRDQICFRKTRSATAHPIQFLPLHSRAPSAIPARTQPAHAREPFVPSRSAESKSRSLPLWPFVSTPSPSMPVSGKLKGLRCEFAPWAGPPSLLQFLPQQLSVLFPAPSLARSRALVVAQPPRHPIHGPSRRPPPPGAPKKSPGLGCCGSLFHSCIVALISPPIPRSNI